MDLELKGKTALVTGSTAGIGYATAVGLLKEGVKVFINGREKEKLKEVLKKIRKEVPDADVDAVAADFSKDEDIESLIKKVDQIDILVNNVGVYGEQPFETTSDEEWMRDFKINVMSGVHLSRHYIPGMKKKKWGRIIFISSESAINIPEDMILYGVTKTALLSLSRGLAKSLRGTQITVNSILPGPTWSAGNLKGMEKTAKEKNITVEEASFEFVKEKRPDSIIQRFAQPEEVANLVVYTASPRASATTGAALRVDGGVVNTAF